MKTRIRLLSLFALPLCLVACVTGDYSSLDLVEIKNKTGSQAQISYCLLDKPDGEKNMTIENDETEFGRFNYKYHTSHYTDPKNANKGAETTYLRAQLTDASRAQYRLCSSQDERNHNSYALINATQNCGAYGMDEVLDDCP